MSFKNIFLFSILVFLSSAKIFSQNTTDTIRAVQNYNPEIDENNLMLVDATLELNEAMLAGIKASLDTLSKPDPELKNKNDVKEILQRMKRARDRKELIPYLEYMNDSLSLDCNKLRTQKQDILSRLTPYIEHQRVQDSLAIAALNPVVASKAPVNTKGKKPVKKVEKVEKKPEAVAAVIIRDTIPVKKKETAVADNSKEPEVKNTSIHDTVIVYDLGKKPEIKPAKEKNQRPTTHVEGKKDIIRKAITDTIRQKQVVDNKKVTWDTARAVIDTKQEQQKKAKATADSIALSKKSSKKANTTIPKNDSSTTATKQIEKKISEPVKRIDTVVVAKKEEKKTTVKAEPKPPLSKRDSVAIKIERDVMQAKAKADSTKKAEPKQTFQKKDTVIVTEAKAPVVKQPEKKIQATTTTTNVDTIQNIKSQFFLKRAQKALAEKKQNLAEEYLNKSLELWNDNYDAWMTLADYEAQYGSPAKALKEYQECARIDSSKPKLFYNIASLHLLSKKKTEALQYFEKTITLDTNYILAYMGRASIYNDWKKYDAAISDYDRVLQINKSYHYAYKARGMVKQLNKRFSEAVDDFTRYLIFEETDPSAYYYRGLAKIGNNELLDGCLDLSKSAEMGYEAAEKAIKKSCE